VPVQSVIVEDFFVCAEPGIITEAVPAKTARASSPVLSGGSPKIFALVTASAPPTEDKKPSNSFPKGMRSAIVSFFDSTFEIPESSLFLTTTVRAPGQYFFNKNLQCEEISPKDSAVFMESTRTGSGSLAYEPLHSNSGGKRNDTQKASLDTM